MSTSYLKEYQKQLEDLDRQFLRRKLRIAQTPTAPTMRIEDQEILTFCSNDYLGLANHPRIIDALKEGIDLYGGGSGASHLINGHSIAHDLLDQALASTQKNHIPQVKAITFSTGYMANLAMITGLVQGLDSSKGITIFSEELNHASLIDSIRLASKQQSLSVKIFEHQNLKQLEQLLQSDPNQSKIIVTDAVFSMDGDIANIPQLVELSKTYNALLVIDDAHGFGVLGAQGHGSLEYFQITPQPHLIYMGTLGKAAGLSGAFIAAHQDITEWIFQKGRPYIYTTASPPMIAHALLSSLKIISEGDVRNQLHQNIKYFKEHLHLKKWQLLSSETAIQPIVIGSNQICLEVAQYLFANHLWTPAIRPPTVQEGTSRLRITLSAAHTLSQIDQLITTLHTAEEKFHA